MKETTLDEFINNHAESNNLCSDYKEYSKEVREMLKNVFATCWRFNLRSSQTIYMLDMALKPFDKNELNLLG